MEKDIDARIIKATQASLGKYVKRPPLSEKLLKKPPFRFLHDIITTVLKTTGFFEGLFEKDELISENVKDREGKIQFLNKTITIIQNTTGKTINVKPSKIVAGQEADKTNELLQCLAQALDNNLSSAEAVKKYKQNDTQVISSIKETKSKETKKKNTNANTINSKSSDNLNNINKEKSQLRKEKNETSRHQKNVKNGSQNKTVQSNTSTKKKKIGIKTKSTEQILEKNYSQASSTNLKEIEAEDRVLREESHTKDTPDQLNTSYALNESDLNSTSSSQNLIGESVTDTSDINCKKSDIDDNALFSSEDQSSIINTTIDISQINDFRSENIESNQTQSNSETNMTTFIEEPKIGKSDVKAQISKNNSLVESEGSPKRSVIQRPFSVRPSSSRPGAPRLREKLESIIPDNEDLVLGKVNIIAENYQHDEEDDNSIIIAEQNDSSLTQDIPGDSSNVHGHLVQQIMDSQKELSKFSGKTEIEWECSVQKAKETQHQEIEQLRYNIQALSRVANPLGKLLDHIQEDVEVMRQELQQWTNIYNEVTKEMQKQKMINEDSLTPLRTKLKQLDGEINEKQDKVDDLKVIIHKNSTRIEKLLASGNVQ